MVQRRTAAWIVVLAVASGCGGGDASSDGGSGGGSSTGSQSGNPSASNNSNASSSQASATSGGNTGGMAFGDQRSGEGTYYDADGSGACLFDPSPGDLNVAAINAPDWEGSAWCGACAEVVGPDGSVTLRIVDLCPECASGDLDLSPQAFERIAPIPQGRVPISWTFVSCAVSSPVQYRYKDGTNPWWTAVQVLNHRRPVQSLEWSTDGETFHPTVRMDYNYFLDDSGFGDNPVTVRITSVDGQTLTDDLPAPAELLVVEGRAQFR